MQYISSVSGALKTLLASI